MLNTITESKNIISSKIDECSTLEIIQIINQEDQKVAKAIQSILPQIAQVVDEVFQKIKNNGKLFYIGAGTSGRLGILDAAECPPTFGTSPDMVQGIIAGGREALVKAIEGAEDDVEAGINVIIEKGIDANDAVIGLSASGSTPFVVAALLQARVQGAFTAAITANKESELAKVCHRDISIVVGPEVIAGSTRMKSGTAQKLILNMISTAVMIKMGKTYGNLMVDLLATNKKLKQRALSLVETVAGVERDHAEAVLEQCDWHVKTAILMILAGVDVHNAQEIIDAHDGFLKAAILSKRSGKK